jgi:uroporphyrinogen III methyltransferase/synthase
MPRRPDLESLQPEPAGRVVFVGAGPGAPDLLTLRASERLALAEVVVHDRLVHPQVMALLPATCERICIDRRDTTDADPGATTGELLVRLAATGRCVVRLKGGDPTIFARLAEELAPLQRAGVAVEIVPGVTAALAAAAVAVMPLTNRTEASSLTFVTGHEARGKDEPVDLGPFAKLPGTLVVYMGVEQIAAWSRRLIEAGRAADTPVTLVSRCSWPDQRVATVTLAETAAVAARDGWQSPAVLIVGAVAEGVGKGPLAGQSVIVTRPAGQEGEIASLVRAAGGNCLPVPTIRIAPPADPAPLDAVVGRLDSYDWIVFASANGVNGFLDALRTAGRDGRALGTARLAAIGPATRRSLAAAGFVCDLVPDEFRSEGLVASFGPLPPGGRFLLVRASRGRELIRRSLEAAGQHVDEVAAYESLPVEQLSAATQAMLSSLESPWVTVTSGAIAEASIRLFGPMIRTRSWRIASLSPVTSAVLRRFGLEPTVEATAATAPELVAAIVRHRQSQTDQPSGSPQAADSPTPISG